MTTKISPEAMAKWPVNTKFKSHRDELDDDDDKERITPAGSVWEVLSVDQDAGFFDIGCPATGACIRPSEQCLLTDFTQILD